MTKPKRFLPYAATCGKCGDLIVTTRPRHFVSCKCGLSSIDAGDGYYWRGVGLVSQVWKMRRPTKAKPHASWQNLKVNFSQTIDNE